MDDIIKPGEVKPKSSNASYEIPFDAVPLPSNGLLYVDGPLAGKEFIEVHYLTATQEDILTSPNLLQSGRMLDVLIRSVLKDKTINPEKLLLGDRNAIIIWLRSTGYGSEYPVIVKCPSCGSEWTNEFDLSSLGVNVLDESPDSDGLFSFTMPQTKKEVRFKFLTSEDEVLIMKKVDAIKKKQGSSVDKTLSLKLMQSIVEVDGSRDALTIKNFVEYLPVKDSRAFRDHITKMEPGVIMSQDCECPSCGNTSQEVIPIRANFFWPDSGV